MDNDRVTASSATSMGGVRCCHAACMAGQRWRKAQLSAVLSCCIGRAFNSTAALAPLMTCAADSEVRLRPVPQWGGATHRAGL